MYGYYGAQVQIEPGVTVEGGSAGYTPESMTLSYDRSDNRRNCISQGAQGNDASSLSWLLAKAGYLSERDYWDAQDYFTPAMRTALIAFQQANGLSADGIAGPNTWAKLGDVGASCASSRVGTYSSSGSGSSQLSVLTKQGFFASDPNLPFYKQKWFMLSVGGVALAGAIALLVVPKKKGRR